MAKAPTKRRKRMSFRIRGVLDMLVVYTPHCGRDLERMVQMALMKSLKDAGAELYFDNFVSASRASAKELS